MKIIKDGNNSIFIGPLDDRCKKFRNTKLKDVTFTPDFAEMDRIHKIQYRDMRLKQIRRRFEN